ncbi:MAG: alpha/beta hydrolase, partial [Ekhidna sp.]|nr:alpha/beta hydrolase [Ekhidna sp.]
MKKLGLCVFNVLAFLAVLGQERVEIAGAEGKSYFLQTDWGKVYYEVYGEGDPLLILHGNGGSAKGRHHMVPDLMENYQVILMDARCHGKSDCTDKDLDYFEMAEDVRFLMTHLDHQKYTIWGHSDGG